MVDWIRRLNTRGRSSVLVNDFGLHHISHDPLDSSLLYRNQSADEFAKQIMIGRTGFRGGNPTFVFQMDFTDPLQLWEFSMYHRFKYGTGEHLWSRYIGGTPEGGEWTEIYQQGIEVTFYKRFQWEPMRMFEIIVSAPKFRLRAHRFVSRDFRDVSTRFSNLDLDRIWEGINRNLDGLMFVMDGHLDSLCSSMFMKLKIRICAPVDVLRIDLAKYHNMTIVSETTFISQNLMGTRGVRLQIHQYRGTPNYPEYIITESETASVLYCVSHEESRTEGISLLSLFTPFDSYIWIGIATSSTLLSLTLTLQRHWKSFPSSTFSILCITLKASVSKYTKLLCVWSLFVIVLSSCYEGLITNHEYYSLPIQGIRYEGFEGST
jgi:hypothetical protein